RYWMTPICAMPRAPPPPSTRDTLFRFLKLIILCSGIIPILLKIILRGPVVRFPIRISRTSVRKISIRVPVENVLLKWSDQTKSYPFPGNGDPIYRIPTQRDRRQHVVFRQTDSYRLIVRPREYLNLDLASSPDNHRRR